MKGCLQDVAIMIATVMSLQIIQGLFGPAVSMAVAITTLIGCIAFLWHIGGKERAK